MRERGVGLAAFVVLLIGIHDKSAIIVVGSAAIVIIVGHTVLWRRFALSRLSCTTTVDHAIANVGDTVMLTVRIVNAKPLPLYRVTVDLELPEQLMLDAIAPIRDGLRRTLSVQCTLWPYGNAQRPVRLRVVRRGSGRIGKLHITVAQPGDRERRFGSGPRGPAIFALPTVRPVRVLEEVMRGDAAASIPRSSTREYGILISGFGDVDDDRLESLMSLAASLVTNRFETGARVRLLLSGVRDEGWLTNDQALALLATWHTAAADDALLAAAIAVPQTTTVLVLVRDDDPGAERLLAQLAAARTIEVVIFCTSDAPNELACTSAANVFSYWYTRLWREQHNRTLYRHAAPARNGRPDIIPENGEAPHDHALLINTTYEDAASVPNDDTRRWSPPAARRCEPPISQ